MINIITDYHKPVIVLDGVFKGIIGTLHSIENGFYEEPTCEISVDYMNIIKVNYSQISSLGDISIFNKYGINIFNNDGTFKNGFEIIKDMKEKNIMPTKILPEITNLRGIVFMENKTNNPVVKSVNVIVPDKVVEVTFSDGTKEKSICLPPDKFSLETAISICISKKIMGGSGAYNNAVKRGMKVYQDKLNKEKAEKTEQERIAKKREKRLAYKERRAAKRVEEEAKRREQEKEEQIEIQKEAYLRAIRELKESENGYIYGE